MVLKHLVDKHNIYFAYGPSRIKKRIHVTAINFVILSIVLTQLCLCFFAYIRRGMRDIAIYSLVGLSGTLLLLTSHVLFHWFQLCSPVRYEVRAVEGKEGMGDTQPCSCGARWERGKHKGLCWRVSPWFAMCINAQY